MFLLYEVWTRWEAIDRLWDRWESMEAAVRAPYRSLRRRHSHPLLPAHAGLMWANFHWNPIFSGRKSDYSGTLIAIYFQGHGIGEWLFLETAGRPQAYEIPDAGLPI